jgi:transcriptional regulator with XRE-family HTH domain
MDADTPIFAARPMLSASGGMDAGLEHEQKRIAFAQFISLARRSRGLSLEKMAEMTETEVDELWAIERDHHSTISALAVFHLARFLKVPTPSLMQLAGLTHDRHHPLPAETVRAAAHSSSTAQLTIEEQRLLDLMIDALGKLPSS